MLITYNLRLEIPASPRFPDGCPTTIPTDAICTMKIQVTRYKKQLDDAMQRRARLKDQLESCSAKFQAKGFDSKPHIEKRLQRWRPLLV